MKAFFTSKVGILLVLIVVGGFFLRAYHFSDWLHFELDQARDARVIDAGLEGDFFDLPLLGPKAAGTALRLPPGFYYLEYVGALIFGSSPAGQAGVVLLFAVAALPALFFLLRRYFSEALSLGLTALFALSPFFILYSRFAWNPNVLPFFLIFGFYALLRAVDKEETRKTMWFALAAFSLAFTGHFHFVAFIGVPVIVALFLILKRPALPWKAWAAAIGIIGILSLPMILNDVKAEGRNTQEFFQAITDKSGKGEHALVEKIVRNVTEQSVGYGVMLVGLERAELPKLRLAPADIMCDGGCREGIIFGLLTAIFYLAGALLLAYRMWRTESGTRRDFLLLMGIWFFITWGLFMNIAYDLAPRFFLLVSPLPFIFVGLLLEGGAGFSRIPRTLRSKILPLGLTVLCLTAGYFTFYRLQALSVAHEEAVEILGPDRILKDRARVTLQQQEMIIDKLEAEVRETGFPIYMHSEPQHRRALKYLMEKRGLANDVLSPHRVYEAGSYYLILRSRSDLGDGMEKYLVSFDEKDRTFFGSLVVIEFVPKAGIPLLPRQDFSIPEKPARDPHAAPRYSWRELWGGGEGLEDDESAE